MQFSILPMTILSIVIICLLEAGTVLVISRKSYILYTRYSFMIRQREVSQLELEEQQNIHKQYQTNDLSLRARMIDNCKG